MKKILFVAYGGGHINIIDLVAQKLLKDPDIEFTILALTMAYNKVVEHYPKGKVKKISDYQHLFQEALPSIKEYGEELLSKNYNVSSGISKEDTIIYLGISMFDLVQEHGEEKARQLYNEKKRQAFLPIETMKKIIAYEKCNIVVSTTSPRFEQASFIAANQLGIQTVEILDLFGKLHPLPEAEHIICINKDVENNLKEQGLTDKRYYHLGQPAIEESAKQILQINKKTVYSKIDIDQNKYTLLYASQVPILHNGDCTYNSSLDYILINDKIFSLLAKLYDDFKINIIFRIHPNESIDDYITYFQKYSFITFVNPNLTMHESISVSDLVVTPYSTLAIEALVSEKLVFTYKNDFDVCYPILEMTRSPFIFSDGFDKLENNISNYLINPNKIDKIDNFLPKHSVNNIIHLLKEL